MRGFAIALAGITLSFSTVDFAVAQEKLGAIKFERNDRVLTWQTINNGDFSLSENLDFRMESELITSLNQRAGYNVKDRWFDKIYNQAELNYAVNDRFNMQFMVEEDWNKDTMNTFGKSLLTTNYGGSVRYTRSRDFWLEGELEHTVDTRFDNEDKGSTAKGKLRYSGIPFVSNRNLAAKFNIDADKSNLKRKKDRFLFNGEIYYDNNFADVSMAVGSRQTIRGYFSDVDRRDEKKRKNLGVKERDQLEQNIELTVSRGDAFSYSNRPAFAINMKLGRGRTEDSANTDSLSSKFHNNSKLSLRDFHFRTSKKLWKWISAGWEAGYRKDEKNVEKKIRSRSQTDIITKGDLSITLGSLDSLSVFGWIKRTRIDTPEGIPYDRDELKFESGVKYNRKFSNNFQIAFDFRVLETHYVNIDVSQSSQNKWMKTYLLSPSLIYIPVSFLSVRHKVNLSANYIEYDYKNPYMLRSNITRRISSETWMDAEISPKTRARLGFRIEENDYGKLNIKGNKIPVEEGIKRFGDISVEYKFAEWLIITPRYIYAIRNDWKIAGNLLDLYRREVDQTYGVECSLFKNKANDYDFIIGAKRIVRKTKSRPLRIRNYVNMTLMYEF